MDTGKGECGGGSSLLISGLLPAEQALLTLQFPPHPQPTKEQGQLLDIPSGAWPHLSLQKAQFKSASQVLSSLNCNRTHFVSKATPHWPRPHFLSKEAGGLPFATRAFHVESWNPY